MMSTKIPPETKYRVQSLERGLLILRELRMANVPVRNQELVSRTGLPKATVSRLLNTLGALNYVRRTDQGSYVLAQGSAHSGRAMLASLGLEQYRDLFAEAPGPVYLEAMAGGRLVPVYRWSRSCAGAVANGSPATLVPIDRIDALDGGDHWEADEGTWWSWIGLHSELVGSFALTAQVKSTRPPPAGQRDELRQMLQRAAKIMNFGRRS